MISLGGVGKFGAAGSACHGDEPARLSAPKALRMLMAFVPVLSESSALGADRYFDYRIENYAEALSDAPVDHVIRHLRRNGKVVIRME